MAEQTVTLNPGESKAVSFETIPEQARWYIVTVDGLTGNFRALAPMTSLSGVVTDASTFLPIARVTVYVAYYAGLEYTNAQGQYSFPSLPIGSCAITFEKEGYASRSDVIGLILGLNEFNLSLVPLPPPLPIAMLWGKIVDRSSSWPLAGVKVTVGGQIDYTDNEGEFFITNLSPGYNTFLFEKVGYYSDAYALLLVEGANYVALSLQKRYT